MKVRARTNGNIVDLPDETAERLIAAGVYEIVEDEVPAGPRKKVLK